MATCSPQELLNLAACFACLSTEEKRIVKLQLLCDIAAAGGGAGVTSIIAGTGISIDQATGAVTVTAIGGGVFAAIGNPNGVLSVTGPAIYFDRTDPLAPIMYSKCTAGTSSTEWI